MTTLNRNNSNWSFEERRKINENWEILEREANSSSSSNNGLRQEVEQIKVQVASNTIRSTAAEQNANQAKAESNRVFGIANEANVKSDVANTNSENAINIANEAKGKAENVETQFNEIVAEAGSSNPEVVQARGGYVNLNTRLTEQQQEIMRLIDEAKFETHISDYPRLAGETNDDGRFSRAIAALPNNLGIVRLGSETYTITQPIIFGQFQGMRGTAGSTKITKQGNGTGGFRSDCYVGTRTTTDYIYGLRLSDIDFVGNGSSTCLDLGRSSNIIIENVRMSSVFARGIIGEDVWLATFNDIIAWNDAPGEIFFDIRDGTSNYINRCWSKNYERGFNLGSMLYCALTACACDTFTRFAYTGGQSVVYNGCGAEDANLMDNAYCFGNSYRNITMNNCQSLNIRTQSTIPGSSSIMRFQGARATVNGYRLDTFLTPGMINIVNAVDDDKIIINNSTFPTNFFQEARIDTDFGEVVFNLGSLSRVRTRQQNINKDISTDYRNGYSLTTPRLASGKRIGENTFTGIGVAQENSYLIYTTENTVKIPILKSDTITPGNFTVSVVLEIQASVTNSNTNLRKSSFYNSYLDNKNGSKTVISLLKRAGDDLNLNITWESDNILYAECTEKYASVYINARVLQMATNGQALNTWM